MSENPAGIGAPTLVQDGPMAGWSTWGLGSDPFETLTGPYYMKPDGQGGQVCAFVPGPQNANGMGNIHGGSLMTFADFALFAHAVDHMKGGPCVTVQFESQFIGGAVVGTMITSSGEVTRATRTMIFVRGLMEQDGKPILAYSGILKRVGV